MKTNATIPVTITNIRFVDDGVAVAFASTAPTSYAMRLR
jgi:hypothetical protein